MPTANPTIDRDLAQDLIRQCQTGLARVPEGLKLLRINDEPHARYRWMPNSPRPWCVYGTINGLGLEQRLGIFQQRPPEQQRACLELIRSHQDPTDGLIRCSVCPDDDSDPMWRCQENVRFRSGVTKKAAIVLDNQFPHPIPVDDSAIPEPIEEFLAQSFAELGPYGGGSTCGHLLGIRAIALRSQGRDPREDPIVRRGLDWILAGQNPDTGFFHAGDDLVNGMNGLLKMRHGVFNATGTPIPRKDRILETILSLQAPDGRFGRSCGDWNATTLLITCAWDEPAAWPRVLAAYEHVVPAVLAKQTPEGLFCESPGQGEPAMVYTNVNSAALSDAARFAQHMLDNAA